MEGFLVCIEGIDGAGKHTQVEMLANELKKKGIEAKVYTYPDYNSDYGKMIDRYLHGHLRLNVDEQILLHLADKVKDNMQVRKDIESGAVVIMDRYFYSTIAYQCAAGFDYERAKKLVDLMNTNVPSVVVYIDIPIDLVAERKAKQKGYTDKNERNTKYQLDVKGVYDKMMGEKYATKWVKVDGTQKILDVHAKIMSELKKSGLKA